MATTEVTTSAYGITIHIPSAMDYDIGWWQIERDGYEKWVSHLSEKSWFTIEAINRFIDICQERNMSRYFN